VNSKKSQTDVLLVEIKSVDRWQLSQVLTEAGFNPVTVAKSQQYTQCNPRLIVVDTKYHGADVITQVKNTYSLKGAVLPPIMAIVDSAHCDRTAVFALGAYDYISSPLIVAELNVRLIQALNHDDNAGKINKGISGNESQNLMQLIGQNSVANAELLLAKKTADHLLSQLDSDVNLNDLARFMGTNRNKLGQVFKACTGISVINWLREQRMFHAAQLLKDTDCTIQQAGEQVNYPNQNNFSTGFKRVFDCSPSKYRINSRKPGAGKQKYENPRQMQHANKLMQPAKILSA
jgi:AraC-like DNA-binding protein/CheY-like chemotaxis protein